MLKDAHEAIVSIWCKQENLLYNCRVWSLKAEEALPNLVAGNESSIW